MSDSKVSNTEPSTESNSEPNSEPNAMCDLTSRVNVIMSYLNDRETSTDIPKLISYFAENGSIVDELKITYRGTDSLTNYYTNNAPPSITPYRNLPVFKNDHTIVVTLTFMMVKTYDITFTFEDNSNLFKNISIVKTSWL